MIYEFRTYDLTPGSVPEVMNRFGEAYEKRKEFSELSAFWYTEIGPLNQIIHVWPYDDTNQRDQIRSEAVKAGVWPPDIGEFIQYQSVEILKPWPFSPQLTPGELGPYYEMRSYQSKPRTLPDTQERWQSKLEERLALSPLCGVFTVDIGEALKMVHIWPYKDLNERQSVRGEAAEKGIWPPKGGGPTFFSQENKIMLPAPFSPMQ